MTTTSTTTTVTAEQIARCHRTIDENTHTVFYMVENEGGKVDHEGRIIEYKVQAVRIKGRWYFTCTCKAGQHGFTNCKAGVCKHVVWSKAAAQEYKELIKAEAQAQARNDAYKIERERLYKELNIGYASPSVTNEDLARIIERNKKPVPTHYPCIQARPFSILK